MTKIRLTCNWCDDSALYERFKRCYISKYNSDSNIIFTDSSEYDWLVIINHPQYPINFPKERTIGVIMEPTWTTHYQLKYILEKYCKHIISHKKETNSQYIFYPGLLPYHFDYNAGENLDYYIENTFSKNKKCSMVVSYSETTPHPSCIYKQRTNFAKLILESDLDIDIYGNGWENSGIKDSRIKGQIKNKKDALLDYNFSIAIENCVEENYFTEKITDCILTNTASIYFGCPNIKKYITNNVFALSHLNDLNELKQILTSNSTLLNYNKKEHAQKYNLYTAIKQYIIKTNNI